MSKRVWAAAAGIVLLGACASQAASAPTQAAARYLFVWAGDKDAQESDFLAVVDLRKGSLTYGDVVATLPVGAKGTMPHHVEYETPRGGLLFADGWVGGLTSLIDLRNPLEPKLVRQLTDMGGMSFPHSYARLDNGNVLVTLQGRNGRYGAPGGLAELSPDGTVLRTASAVTPSTPEGEAWPYSLAVAPGTDRAIVSLTEMGWPPFEQFHRGRQVQIWSPSQMRVLASVPLPETTGEYHLDPAEPRVMPDGRVYVSTFTCGLFRIDGITEGPPSASLVHAFPGGTTAHNSCSVPVVMGNFWVQTVPEVNGLVAVDLSNPDHPKEAARLSFDAAFHMPHWAAADRGSDRIVVTGNNESWALVVKVDQATGAMKVDESLAGGVNFDRLTWPHGASGPAVVHGALFGG